MNPTTWQRLEAALIAIAAVVGGVAALGIAWWWPFALFLAFDLSMAGYLAGAGPGAVVYNAVHTYIGPAILLGVSVAVGGSAWIAVIGLAWVFHVAVDRALGYGLKFDDAFEHTHLGWIGRRHGAPGAR